MCSSEYDLMCEECRRRFDRIFSVKIKSAEQERRLLAKWLKSLCSARASLYEQILPLSSTT